CLSRRPRRTAACWKKRWRRWTPNWRTDRRLADASEAGRDASVNQVESGLPAVDPAPSRFEEACILFEREPHFLVVPLRNLRCRVELDGVPRVRAERVVSPHRHAFLVVGHANRRTCPVSV